MEFGCRRAEFPHVAEDRDPPPAFAGSAWPRRAIAARIEAGLAL